MGTTWTRWPSAELVRSETLLTQRVGGEIVREHAWWAWKATPGTTPLRDYALAEHGGAWRSFSECLNDSATTESHGCDAFDEARLTKFIRRYGVLHYRHGPSEWFASVAVACALRDWAELWSDDPECSLPSLSLAEANPFLGSRVLNAAGDRDDLARFMARNAHWSAVTGQRMRRCAGCGNWMILAKNTRRFCNSTCRNPRGEG